MHKMNKVDKKAYRAFPDKYTYDSYEGTWVNNNQYKRDGYTAGYNAATRGAMKKTWWAAVDMDGEAFLFEKKPKREVYNTTGHDGYVKEVGFWEEEEGSEVLSVPEFFDKTSGFMSKITWKDEPVKVELIIRKAE